MNNEYTEETTVTVKFTVKTDQHESDEMISCFIPEINTYFSAKTPEDVQRKASVMIKSWVGYFNEKNQKGKCST